MVARPQRHNWTSPQVTVDAEGNVYVVERGGQRVRQV